MPLLPGSGSTDINDILAQTHPADRAAELLRIISVPALKLPRQPVAKVRKVTKTAEDTRVDWEGCRVVRVPILTDLDGNEEEGRSIVLSNAGHRIEEVQTVLDDRRQTTPKPVIRYGVRSAIIDPATEERVESGVYPVAAGEFLRPEEWTQSATFENGDLARRVTVSPGQGWLLANTIKENDHPASAVTIQKTPGYRTLGGKHVYTCLKHSIGADGAHPELRTDFGKDGGVTLPVPGVTAAEKIDRINRIFGVLRRDMTRPGPWDAGMAHALAPLAQIDPIGLTIHQGITSSGKTTIAHLIINTVRGPGVSLGSADDTAGVIGDAAKGAHNTTVVIDDGRDLADPSDQASQDRGLGRTGRIGVDGAARSRARLSNAARDGEWTAGERDTAFPAMQVSAERPLVAGSASDLNRALTFVYDITKPIFKTSELALRAAARGKAGYYADGIADIISLNCAAMDGRRQVHHRGQDYCSWNEAADAEATLFESTHQVTNRTARIAAARIAAAHWLRWVIAPLVEADSKEARELTEAVDRFIAGVEDVVTRAALTLEKVTMLTETPAIQLVAEIKQLLAGHRATTQQDHDGDPADRRPVIMSVSADRVYLFASVIASLLGGKRSGTAIVNTLSQHPGLVVAPKTTTRVGTATVPAAALNRSLFELANDEAAIPDEVGDGLDDGERLLNEPDQAPTSPAQPDDTTDLPDKIKSTQLASFGLDPELDDDYPTADAGLGRIWVTLEDTRRWANWSREAFDNYRGATEMHAGLFRGDLGVVTHVPLSVFIGLCGGCGENHRSCEYEFCGAPSMAALATLADGKKAA